MACSKSWLYKWRDRYQPSDPAWSQTRSRRPLTHPSQTPEGLSQDIVRVKHALEKNGHRVGAPAIQQALKEQGIEPVPSQRTIYRILARHEKEVKHPPPHPESVHPPGNVQPL